MKSQKERENMLMEITIPKDQFEKMDIDELTDFFENKLGKAIMREMIAPRCTADNDKKDNGKLYGEIGFDKDGGNAKVGFEWKF